MEEHPLWLGNDPATSETNEVSDGDGSSLGDTSADSSDTTTSDTTTDDTTTDDTTTDDTTTGADTWLDPSCVLRVPLTIDNANSNEDLANFPLAIRLNAQRVDYDDFASEGTDLRFYWGDDESGLPHEIERWNTGGESLVWVRAPNIPAQSTTEVLWMYYSCSDSVAEEPASLWTEQLAVWHLNEAAPGSSGAAHADASGNGHSGSQQGNTGADAYLAGGQSMSFGDHILVPDNAGLDLDGPFTIQAWVRVDGTNNGFAALVSKYDFGFDQRSYMLYLRDMEARFLVSSDGVDSDTVAQSNTDLSAGSWHHVAGSWDGSSAPGALTLYLDGALVGEFDGPTPTGVFNGSADLLLGCQLDGGSTTQCLDGDLDEVRVTALARSAAWIEAEYRSMADMMLSYGAPENE